MILKVHVKLTEPVLLNVESSAFQTEKNSCSRIATGGHINDLNRPGIIVLISFQVLKVYEVFCHFC